MFRLFRKSQHRSHSNRRAPRRFRIESLESRNCMSAVSLGLSAQTTTGQNVEVSVMVMGTEDSYQVSLSGPVSASVSVDSSGWAMYTGPATGLGTITGTVSDSDGDTAQASCEIADSPPLINSLTVVATGQGKQVEVSGSVTAPSPGGLAVTFSGSAGLDDTGATTDAYGDFDLVTTATSLGDVSAVVKDVWGVNSAPMTTTLTVQPPQIVGLTAVDIGNGYWEMQGTVNGPDAADDSVALSGMASASASPDSTGSFSVIVYFGSEYPNGTEYAVATDVWGQSSAQSSYTLST